MTRLRGFVPDSLAGRFALLLATALIVANLVALALLTFERERLGRAAREAREIERIVSLVPAIEAIDPALRRGIARDASTRFSRVTVDAQPLVEVTRPDARSRAVAEQLSQALSGRDLRVAILEGGRPGAREARFGGPGSQAAIAVSIRLDPSGADVAAPPWLNVLSAAGRPDRGNFEEGVFLVVLSLSLVAVLGVGLLFVRHLARPLGQLAEAARAAGRGDRTARVSESGARELRAAAAAFNNMQGQIARFEAERMRTLAAVGHDLRTPITSLRIRVEMLDEAEAAPMIRTLDEMTVMANGLIAYARGAGESEDTERLDLGALLAGLCEERGAELRLEGQAEVAGRPVALRRALGNLIDNAIRYGGRASVALSIAGGEAVVTVEDDGPGVAPERLEAMFAPFVRGENSRSTETGGAGLGLSIARAILSAHGGSIALENREAGGIRAVVKIPLHGTA